MVAKPIQLEEALVLALQLSLLDKVRLLELERVASTLENEERPRTLVFSI